MGNSLVGAQRFQDLPLLEPSGQWHSGFSEPLEAVRNLVFGHVVPLGFAAWISILSADRSRVGLDIS